MSQLFSPLRLRGLEIRNRAWVSPMCQYSAVDGLPNDWHMVHLGSRAVGGAGLVMAEATAVVPEGRISPGDTGIWNDQQADAFARIAMFIRSQGSVAAIQLAHAGRKASTDVPWGGRAALSPADGGWTTVAPSPLPFSDRYAPPREMTAGDIDRVTVDFAAAAERAAEAGFDVVEIHAAHGYLLHEFLSPLSNHRTDEYGGSLENRMRFPLAVAAAVRKAFPRELPVFARISATDWVEGGWDLEQSIAFSRALKEAGIDLVDCSTGGNAAKASIPVGPGYQVPFAEAIRREAGIATAAVGMIIEPAQAEQIIAAGQADAVLLARSMLYDPYWPLHAAEELEVELPWPVQYGRVKTQPRSISRAAD
jgi:2,4-dienoyl-CoA reductase-like NADH-dependent reductase (Old Yellow Enzyme family)